MRRRRRRSSSAISSAASSWASVSHRETGRTAAAVSGVLEETGGAEAAPSSFAIRRVRGDTARTCAARGCGVGLWGPRVASAWGFGAQPRLTRPRGWQPVARAPLHSNGAASGPPALLLGRILPVFSLGAPWWTGASPFSVRRGVLRRAAGAPASDRVGYKSVVGAIEEAAHVRGSRVQSGALGSPRSARVGFGAQPRLTILRGVGQSPT